MRNEGEVLEEEKEKEIIQRIKIIRGNGLRDW